MKEVDLGRTMTVEFDQQNLVIALDKKFLKLNNGKPLEFEAKINEKNQLVLSAPLAAKGDKTPIPGEIDGKR